MRVTLRAAGAVLATSAALAAFAGVFTGVFAGARATRPGRRPPGPGAHGAPATFAADVDALAEALDTFAHVADTDTAGGASLRAAYRAARLRYKHAECWVEFYAPAMAAALNSSRPDVEDDDAPLPATLVANGFPALERIVFAAATPRRDSLLLIANEMRSALAALKQQVALLSMTDAQAVELVRLEIARVATLGIAGIDAPRSRAAIVESAEALRGTRELLAAVGEDRWIGAGTELARALRALDTASGYLRGHPDFDAFNRLAFIVRYEEPAARAVDMLRRQLQVAPIQIPRAWRFDSPSVYTRGAFDPMAYAPARATAASPALIALGRTLFHEARLSGTGSRSCASCHDPARAFTDGMRKNADVRDSARPIARNTPTLLNAALQPEQFADARAATLEDQIVEVLRSPAEMGSSIDGAAARLRRDPGYAWRFELAFADSARAGVTAWRLRAALAAYVRSLVALRSPFDRAVQGDTVAMSASQRRGFNLFMGRAGCGTCHYAPLFSGVTPPLYLANDAEVVGAPASAQDRAVDPDSGRARIDHRPDHLHAFKTPSLRNVAVTGPYMHNGVFATLDQVIAFYDHGGGQGAGAHVPNQTLPPDSLRLSLVDRRDLIAFLHALTDTMPGPP